jgi:predicted kinase
MSGTSSSNNNDDKIIYILRGISGSGKSTLAKEILNQEGNKNGKVFSADDYFINKETNMYEYKADKIGAAHAWAQNNAFRALQQGVTPILIDNTHTQCWEAKPYVEEALKHGYKVIIKEPTTPWAKNPEELAKRNVHGVPVEKIRDMLKRWDNDFTVESIMKSKSKFNKRKNDARNDSNKRPKTNNKIYSAVMKDGKSQVHNMVGYIGIFGETIEELLVKNPVGFVPTEYEQQREKRDGCKDHHLTLFFKPEFKTAIGNLEKAFPNRVNELKQKNGTQKYNSFEGNEKLLVDVLVAEVDCDWKNLGIGKVKKGDDETMYQVLEWPSGNTFRKKLGLDKRDFHLTLGFKNADIHNGKRHE